MVEAEVAERDARRLIERLRATPKGTPKRRRLAEQAIAATKVAIAIRSTKDQGNG
jgi:hypothetical protein